MSSLLPGAALGELYLSSAVPCCFSDSKRADNHIGDDGAYVIAKSLDRLPHLNTIYLSGARTSSMQDRFDSDTCCKVTSLLTRVLVCLPRHYRGTTPSPRSTFSVRHCLSVIISVELTALSLAIRALPRMRITHNVCLTKPCSESYRRRGGHSDLAHADRERLA